MTGPGVPLLRILQLSDTHLHGDATRHYGRIDTGAALAGLLERLEDVGPLDAVIHCGDASEDGTEESYRRLAAQLAPFAARHGAQWTVAMGNHDLPGPFAAVLGAGDHAGHLDHTVDLPGAGRIVVLDSSVPGAGYGRLDPGQLDWLAGVLARPADGAGTVLVIHHPPLAAATPLLRGLDLVNPGDLAAVLAGSDVRLVLAGHYHHTLTARIGTIPVHVAPGVTNVVDPLVPGGEEIALPLSGASLLDVDAAGPPRVTTTVVPNAGDVPGQAGPVYRLGQDMVAQIVRAAGPPRS